MRLLFVLVMGVFVWGVMDVALYAQPSIEACECVNWNKNPGITIDGVVYDSDRKIFPTRHLQWDWKSVVPATRHNPGAQVEDIEAFINPIDLADKCDVIIVSRGQIGVLLVNAALLEFLRKEKCTVFYDQLPSKSKCPWTEDRLNEIAHAIKVSKDKKPVVLFLHTSDAVDFYSGLVRDGYKVSALIHLTC